jgi:hypothetical protein
MSDKDTDAELEPNIEDSHRSIAKHNKDFYIESNA